MSLLKPLLASALVAVSSMGLQAHAQTPVRLSIVVPQNSHLGVGIDTFAAELGKLSKGKFKVQTFYAGALGSEREQVESVQMGSQEMAFATTGVLANFVPETRVIDVPFLFRDYAHARAVLDGEVGKEMLAKFDAKGMKALAWGENGFRHVTNNKRPIEKPEDLKGLKLRTMENPIHIRAYREFGVQPTPMAMTEVFSALQQNVVDGQENPVSMIVASKFDQVQKHMSLTGHAYGAAVFLVNKKFYDGLGADDRANFAAAAAAGVKANRMRIDEDEKNGVALLRSHGMQVVTNVDRAKFQAMLTPAYAEFNKQFGQATFDRIRSTQP